jgi:ribonuclease R
MDPKETLLEVLSRKPVRSWPIKELMGAAGLHEGKEKTVRRTLKTLVGEGKVEREVGKRYRLSRFGQTLEGTVRANPRGRLELVIDKKSSVPILPSEIEARDGDRVRAEIEPGRRGGGTARVVELLIPAKAERLIGVVRRLGRAVFIEPETKKDQRTPPAPVMLEPGADFEDGQLVEYQIVSPRTRSHAAVGRVIERLGKPGDRETELQRLLIEHDLPRGFPKEVEAVAAKLGTEVDPTESGKRRDLRSLALVTIDSETARDFDDAVYAEKQGKDNFKLYVAIADVAHYVRDQDPIDREALHRGTSVYFTDRVFPMLPEALSNNLCSLKPNVDRLCVVAEMIIDRDGDLVESQFYRAVMRSRARLTYTQVAKALDGQTDDVTGPLLPGIMILYHVAQLRLRRRLLRGSIDLDLPESEVVFDAEGLPVDSVRRERNDAHRLIEDLMLAANEAVAAYFEDRELPTIFRIHEDPDPLKLEAFVELCQSIGLPAKLKRGKIRPKDVALLLQDLSKHESGKHLHGLLLRTLAQARYYPENEGHFGLAAERYLHFTSPIRRYPDLMVHRLLTAHIDGRSTGYSLEELKSIAEQSSTAERRAMLAERSCKDLDRAYVAALHVGEPLSGTVSSIAGFGVFVAIDRPFVEGLVPIHQLGDDWYEADEHGAFLYGRSSGKTISLGMPITVEVVNVSIARRQVELRPVSADEAPRKQRRSEGHRPTHKQRKDDRPRSGRRSADERPRRKGGRRR